MEFVARIAAIRGGFEASGYRRVGAALRDRGIVAEGTEIRRLIREQTLPPRRRRRFVAAIGGDRDGPIFLDRAKGMGTDGPNQFRVADITGIAIATGRCPAHGGGAQVRHRRPETPPGRPPPHGRAACLKASRRPLPRGFPVRSESIEELWVLKGGLTGAAALGAAGCSRPSDALTSQLRPAKHGRLVDLEPIPVGGRSAR